MGLCISLVRLIKTNVTTEDSTIAYVVHTMYGRSLLMEERFEGETVHIASLFHGSYGAYRDFRNALSCFGLGKTAEDAWAVSDGIPVEWPFPNPLYYLVYFSDCEGYIGPKALSELVPELKALLTRLPEDTSGFRRVIDKMVHSYEGEADKQELFWRFG